MLFQFTGNLTADATTRTTSNEKEVVNFSIALNHSYKPKNGERVKKVTYVKCAYWLSTAVVAYLKKGKPVQITGFPSVSAYLNQQGEPIGQLEMNVTTIDFLAVGQGATTTAPAHTPVSQPAEAVDDLPF